MKIKTFWLLVLLAALSRAEIEPEPMGVVGTLPEIYPPHWIIAQDASWLHPSDGKFIVLDADSDDHGGRFKGMFNGSYVGQFYQAKTKPEMYVAESFHSRGNRGTRTDVLTIYDKRTLSPTGEVVIPPKRALVLPSNYYLQLVDNERIALVYNFTPAMSVSVVDVVERRFLGEIPIPGCAPIYPMAGRAFAALCADGSMLSVRLDGNGKRQSSERSERFFDADKDPLIEKPAIIDGVAYFASFLGNVVPVDLGGDAPVVRESWSLVVGEDGGWRPGGINLVASDSGGLLYVMMHPDGYDGSHKDPGVEVWVFDPAKQVLLRRMPLTVPAITMALTRDDDPLLVTTNVNMQVDVYRAGDGEHLRTLEQFGQETVLLLHGSH